MTVAQTLKGLLTKEPVRLDPRRAHAPLQGGRRSGENENPYLSARRTWNDHTAALMKSRQTWQLLGLFSLAIALTSIGGIIHIGSQSKFIPYVVEVDQLGRVQAYARADQSHATDPRILRAQLAAFITNARMVTPDVILQRNAVFSVYALLGAQDAGTTKMNEWMNGTPESSPFKRAAKETVSVDIKAILQQTPETWQVEWIETTRERSGALIGQPVRWKALITLYTSVPTPSTTEEQLRLNPVGTYVRDFSWTKEI